MVTRVCPVCLRKSEEGGAHPACCRALYGADAPPQLPVALKDIERMAIQTVNQRLALTGVQRKLSLSYAGSGADRRLTVIGVLGGSHILKPPTPDYPAMPELEHWTMVLARNCGLITAECGLIALSSGEPAYITRRFDRDGERRIHVEDLCQLSGQTTADKYRSSMEKVGTILRSLVTVPGEDALRFLEVTVFCFLVGNSDMHLKNWSVIRNRGRIVLSPAYDLLPVRLLVRDPEESALPIHGRKNRLRRLDFEALATHLKIPDVVTRRTLVDLPSRLLKAIEERSSPWVPQPKADAMKAQVRKNAARLD